MEELCTFLNEYLGSVVIEFAFVVYVYMMYMKYHDFTSSYNAAIMNYVVDTNGVAQAIVEPPGSPVIKRTKHEVKSAMKAARIQNEVPGRWGRALLSACYAVWFVHLPSFLATMSMQERPAVVRLAFQILCDAQQRLRCPADEVNVATSCLLHNFYPTS